MDLKDSVIGFIGGGNMASAIADGLMSKGIVSSSQIIVSCLSKSTLQKWQRRNVEATHSNSTVIRKSNIIILAFKPYQLDLVCMSLSSEYEGSKLFISILAGISGNLIYNKLKPYFTEKFRLIRVMPNTPLLVGEGCSGICPHSSGTSDDVKVVEKIFSSLGKSEIVQESQMHAITGLIGSGPAYVGIYMVIEALSDGAVKQGLPRKLATTFAAQTVLGSAKMVLETQKHPGELKDEVCSAGGTTIYGLHALEKAGVRAALMNGIEAATQRSLTLGGESRGEPHH